MPPVCDDMTCCDTEVKCGDGAGHTCSAGFQDKVNRAAILCTGMPPVCNDATCCDAEVKCGGHVCGAGFTDKVDKASVVCGALAADCSDAKCCTANVLCNVFTCSSGFQDKASKATIICVGMPAVCDDATCCDAEVKCGDGTGHMCSARFQDKADKATILCVGVPPRCDDATCCDAVVRCGGHVCSSGFRDAAGKGQTVCGGMPPACDDATCCDAEVKCDTHTCGAGKRAKATQTLLCAGQPPLCDDATCCDVTCASHTCGVGFVGKVDVAMCPEQGCDNALCCDTTCAHADFTCKDSATVKEGADGITCGATAGSCTQSQCCDAAVKGARDTPTSGMSVKAKERLQSTTDVASVAAVGTANGGKLALLKNFGCLMDDVDLGDDPLDWEFHPTQVAFGSTHSKYFYAALVLNPLILVGFGLLACAVAYATKLWMQSPTPRAFGDARAPGVVYLMHIFLLQGTSLVAAQVCFAAGKHSVGVVVLSWFVLIGCVASPAVVYFGVLRRVPVHSVVVGDPAIYGDGEGKVGKRANARWYKFLFGTEIWVSKEGYFAEQYGMVFENLRADCLWYITAESGVILSLSLLSAIKPSSLTTCDLRNFTIAAILVAFFLACLLKRPFIAPVDNCIAIMLSFLMAVAVVAMSLALALEVAKGNWLYAVSEWTLLFSALLMIAKVVWDIAQYVADVVVSRRSNARELARQREADSQAAEELFEFVNDAELVASLSSLAAPPLLPPRTHPTRFPVIQRSSEELQSLAATCRSSSPKPAADPSNVWSSLTDPVLPGRVIDLAATAPQPYLALAGDEESLGDTRGSPKKKPRSRSKRGQVWV